MSDIEKDFAEAYRKHLFFEGPRFREINLEAFEKKLNEFETRLADKSPNIQKLVDVHEELHKEILKLSEAAVLREAYLYFQKKDCLFGKIRKFTLRFRDLMDRMFEQIDLQE